MPFRKKTEKRKTKGRFRQARKPKQLRAQIQMQETREVRNEWKRRRDSYSY